MKQTCFPEISNKLPLCLFNDFPLSKTEEIGIQKLFFFWYNMEDLLLDKQPEISSAQRIHELSATSSQNNW